MLHESDKPDFVFPKHILFHFKGEYGEKFKDSNFEPELHIYPIVEYRKQFAVSKQMIAVFNGNLSYLKQTLTKKPLSFKNQLPFIDFVDAGQVFNAQIKYAKFRNGEGLWFLTQYNFEPNLINNQGLTYIFQGLTTDEKYYISATFPVSSKLLPPNGETKNTDYNKNKKKYSQYLSKIQIQLQNSTSQDFQPNLQYFQNIVASLKID